MPNPPDPIKTYLDDVCLNLKMMPEDDVDLIRAELRQHLDASVDALVVDGLDRAKAVDEAIRRFGKAGRVGKEIAAKSPNAWVWNRDKQGAPDLPEVPAVLFVAMFLGTVIASCCDHFYRHAGWSTPTSALVYIIGGVLLEIRTFTRSVFERDLIGSIRDAIETARSTSAAHNRLLRSTGLGKLYVNLRSAVTRAVNMGAWPYGATLGCFWCLLEGIFDHFENRGYNMAIHWLEYALGALLARTVLRMRARRVSRA